jgi:hypothetical protein
MRKLALALSLAALSACHENVTGSDAAARPAADAPSERLYVISEPPPPPTDTGAVAFTSGGTFAFNTTYLLNKPGTNGYLSFSGAQPEGTTASPAARVTYHKGEFSGRGTLSFAGAQGTVVIDLASVNAASRFASCAEGCFSVGFDRVTLTTADGTTRPLQGGARMQPARAVKDEGEGKIP